MTSAAEYNAAQIAAGKLGPAHVTELVRYWQHGHGLPQDGMAGPVTLASIATSARATATPPPFLRSPLPVLVDGRRAVITSGFRPADRTNHDGCDWFYPWRPGDEPSFVGDHGGAGPNPHGPPRWVVPTGTMAIAAAPGVVTMAGDSATGHRVWIDHGNGYQTGYFHLLDLRVKRGDQVVSGTSLGLVGDNPADNDGRHLHFELSPTPGYSPIDPEPFLLR